VDDFEKQAMQALEAISRQIDASGLDCDVEQKGDGVIDVCLSNGTHVIVNRHAAAREIWVAAKSGGYHYRWENGRWLNRRNGEELFAALSRCLSEQAGEPVVLEPGPR
jgi:CyaY protein